MASADNGETRALKLSNLIAAAVFVIGAGGAIAVTYGVNQADIATLEKRADQQSQDIRSNQTQLSAHDKELAVIDTKLDYITGKLDEIDSKLDGKQ